MKLHLQNSVVIVVGGASGIGLASVDGFLAEGATVAIWDSSPDCRDVADARPQCHAYSVDITDEKAVIAAAKQVDQDIGAVDHLVHTAAVGSGTFGVPFTRLAPSEWRKVIDVNLQGMVHVAHALTPGMTDRGRGTMVFVSSVAGQIGSPTDPPYSASKAAGINFAQVMARDLAADGIRVNTVCPGMVQTPLNRNVWQSWNDRQAESDRLSYDEWAAEKIRQLVPLGRWQKAKDVADMIVFLSSVRANQVTGQTINVDGGYVMHS